jgi:uncharacterized protein (TIGR02453 family)
MADGYFSQQTLRFLTALTLNNNRDWFEAHKAEYETLVREPALELVRNFAPSLKKISPHLLAVDKKIGGSLMRVHRDARFSADKSPYKTNIGIQFRHEVGKDVHAPGLYFHVAPGECFIGAGVWHPDAEALGRIRKRILDKPKEWAKVSQQPKFRALFDLSGDSLSRAPRGVDPEHPAVEDLKRKDHIAGADMTVRDVCSRKLPALLFERFSLTKPYMKFLCDSLGLPF